MKTESVPSTSWRIFLFPNRIRKGAQGNQSRVISRVQPRDATLNKECGPPSAQQAWRSVSKGAPVPCSAFPWLNPNHNTYLELIAHKLGARWPHLLELWFFKGKEGIFTHPCIHLGTHPLVHAVTSFTEHLLCAQTPGIQR